MAVSRTLTKIIKGGDGSIRVQFGKTERVFDSIAHLRIFVADTLTREVLEALFLRLALDRQPALANPAAFEGRTLTIDTSLANWGAIG